MPLKKYSKIWHKNYFQILLRAKYDSFYNLQYVFPRSDRKPPFERSGFCLNASKIVFHGKKAEELFDMSRRRSRKKPPQGFLAIAIFVNLLLFPFFLFSSPKVRC